MTANTLRAEVVEDGAGTTSVLAHVAVGTQTPGTSTAHMTRLGTQVAHRRTLRQNNKHIP